MPLSRDSLNERQWKFIRRMQFRTKQGLERMVWEETELFPEIEAMKAGKQVEGLPNGAFEIEFVNDEAADSPKNSDSN